MSESFVAQSRVIFTMRGFQELPHAATTLRNSLVLPKPFNGPFCFFLVVSVCRFDISGHHVFSNAGDAGNECADIAASLGTKGFISECNVSSFWPARLFYVQRLLNAPQCLSRIAENLHNFLVQSQRG